MDAGTSTVLSRQLDWIRTSETNRDLEFINLLNKMRDDILVAYDIPKVIFASSETTFTNLKEAKKMLWSQTLISIVKKIEDTFNTNLFDKRGIPVHLKFKTNEVPELQEDLSTKLESAQKMYAMNIPMSVINEMLHLGLPEDGWDGWDQPTPSFSFDTPVPNQKAEDIIKEYKKQEAIENEKRLSYDEFALHMEYTKSLNTMLSRERGLSNSVKAFYTSIYKEQIEPWLEKNNEEKSIKDDFVKFIKNLDLSIPFFNSIKDNIEQTFNMGKSRTYSGVGADFNLKNDAALTHLLNRGLKLKDSPDVVKNRIINVLNKNDFTIDEMAKEVSKVWKEASIERAKDNIYNRNHCCI